MKRNRFVVILVAMAMSMLLVQGALAADEELGELLESIEADRFTVVDDLVNRFSKNKETVEELRATLDSASATKLAEIVQNANSLDDVTTILTGKTPEELAEDILTLGDLDKDYVYTPVSPCRIIDTRKGGGGVFFPGQVREFFVYGTTNIVNQGGNLAGCPSPRGEPRGVHIYVVSVPVAAQGNFGAFPANITPPNAAILNYREGVQNIGNAANVKTHYQLGTGGLKIINRFGTSHLVVDILGYYHESDAVSGVDWSSLGSAVTSISDSTLSPTILRQQTITCPGVGERYVVATGSAIFRLYSGSTLASDFVGVRTSLNISNSWNDNTEGSYIARQNVTTVNTTVGVGTISKTHVFTCTGGTSLTVRFMASRSTPSGPSTYADNPSLVLTVYSKRY